MYTIKEIYYTIQGEGFHTGRSAVFVRFSGCNLWSGHEKDRENAICNFCDTDFIGTDGPGGGRFQTPNDLVENILSKWPSRSIEKRFVVFTGGEPLLQLDEELICDDSIWAIHNSKSQAHSLWRCHCLRLRLAQIQHLTLPLVRK